MQFFFYFNLFSPYFLSEEKKKAQSIPPNDYAFS